MARVFGDGKSPETDTMDGQTGAGELFQPDAADKRADFVAHSIIMHVPRKDRGRWGSAVSDTARSQLKTAFAAWYGASGMSREAFRAQFLDPYTQSETVDLLRRAAKGVVEGRSYGDLAQAGAALATAAQQVGVDRWGRFLGDAERRATDAVSTNSVPGVVKASATGADAPVAGAVLLGGLLLYLMQNKRRQSVGTTPTPVLPQVVEIKPPRDAKDPNGAKAPGKPGEAEGFRDPKRGENWVPNPKWARLWVGGRQRRCLDTVRSSRR